MTVLMKRRENLTHEEFLSYWEQVQIPALFSVPESARFTRKAAMQPLVLDVPEGFKVPDWDGIAEAWFDDMESALKVCYCESFAKIVFPINENFLDRSATQVLFSHELEIDLTGYRLALA